MLAGSAVPTAQQALSRATREARMARPLIVLMTMLGFVWIVGGLVDGLGGVVRLLRGSSSDISRTEALLITVGAAAASLTPLIVWIRALGRVWG